MPTALERHRRSPRRRSSSRSSRAGRCTPTPGIHLATVGNVKRQTEPQPLTWVETDSSDAYLPDVNLEPNAGRASPSPDADAPATILADVTGRTCALDVIVPDARAAAEVEAGDVLAFLDTGAYQDAAASNFNALPRPGTAFWSTATRRS